MPHANPADAKRYFKALYWKKRKQLEGMGKTFRKKRRKARTEEERLNRLRKSALKSAKLHADRNRRYVKRRYDTDPAFRLVKCMRATMTRAFKRLAAGRKKSCTEQLLGCTFEQLRLHIQSQFKPGMAWNNYGYRGWHVDHIKPLASFDLFDPEQQKAAFSYKNLQPLWGKENMQKHAKITT
jgi:hypothetical protein